MVVISIKHLKMLKSILIFIKTRQVFIENIPLEISIL